MPTAEEYAQLHLQNEIAAIQQINERHADIDLTLFEKAIIYKYTNDGYAETNKILRQSQGKTFTEYAQLLQAALSKLPAFEGLVYRSVYLTEQVLQRYKEAAKNKEIIEEYAFSSTTINRDVAIFFKGENGQTPNCLFYIYGKTGKHIELISKFGKEEEVLFMPNTQFEILIVTEEIEPGFTTIIMEEI
ncbi:MAG TPA: ADP-ribosyltransferase [Chitinophagaceae bacterium]|nr:ADP-ribosyltransferase [Chitinophagaceae bacterium]